MSNENDTVEIGIEVYPQNEVEIETEPIYGPTGNGITNIEKTSTEGLVDTYTIYYTYTEPTTFTVTNGNGIDRIELTSTEVLTDTYTIYYTNGTIATFTVKNGKGITDISKTSTEGLVDTYTVLYNDGTVSSFTVTNGTTFTPSVDDDGNISWTNDGGKVNPETKNIRGRGVIDGGTKGQLVVKKSDENYDVEWKTFKVSDFENDAGYIDKNVDNLTNYTDTSTLNTELDTKVDKNTDIVAGTHTKITYDKKGLVTSGADLEESDIPSLHLSKISDVTASASEVNVLDGITATTTELNFVDGVTSNVQTQFDTINDKIKEIELFKFPNAIIFGNPTINQGQVSGFTTTSYLQFPFVVDVRNKNFEIDFCFTTSIDVTTKQSIMDSKFGLALGIENGRGFMSMSSNGTSWNIGTVTGEKLLQPNTTYYAKVTWNGTVYKTALSTDGTIFTDDMLVNSSLGLYPVTIYIGGGNASALGRTPTPFKGSINFNKCFVYVAGLLVWQGMDDAGLATRADVSLSNLDSEGQAKFDAKLDVTTKYGSDLSYSNSQLQLKDQDGNLLGNAVTIESSPAIDETTITKNTAGQLQASSLVDLTATVAELNYVDGVTSNIQTQLDNKMPSSTKYGADLSYSNSQLQLKDQDGNAIGSSVTIESSPAIDNSTITKNTSGQLQASSLVNLTSTITELNYVDGVTSNIQTQLNGKQPTISNLSEIESNASAGKSASDTIATYGDVVTHNTSEFATSAQGTKADSALQGTDVINNVTSTTTDKPLSANMGKELQDEIDVLKARGRFLALWNCATGLAQSDPSTSPYTYKTGDYYIIGTVATGENKNYKPTGTEYVIGTASTVEETQSVSVDDVYYYDGSSWHLQINTQKTVSFANIAGQPTDNSNLAAALNSKVSDVQVNGTSVVTSGVANIPLATNSVLGAVKVDNTTIQATDGVIKAKSLDGLTSTVSELNVLDGITATTTELNYTDGVTSNIQTQLDSKTVVTLVDWD